MKNSKFRLSSFKNAFEGITEIFSEANFKVQLIILLIVIIAGFIFKIDNTEWIIIAIVSSLVFTAEAFNTSIENICDFIEPEQDERIKKIKDISAGAVLISAIGAAAVGVIIFLPKLIDLL